MRDFKLNEILKFDLSPLVNLKPKSPPLEKVARTFQSNIERNQGVFTLLPGIVFVSMRHQQATAEATFKVLGHPTPTDQEKVQPVLKERMLEELKKELEKRAAEDNANRPAASDAILRGGIHNVQQFASSLPLSLGVGTEALLNSIIISAWTSFEVITSDVWTTAIDYGPEKLTDKIYLNLARQTKIKDEGGLVFSLRSKPGSFFLETQQVSFQSIRAIYEAYELAFDKPACWIIEKTDERYIAALAAVRNILVHKRGSIDSQFVQQVQPFPELRRLPMGSQFEVDGQILTRLLHAAVRVGTALISHVDDYVINSSI